MKIKGLTISSLVVMLLMLVGSTICFADETSENSESLIPFNITTELPDNQFDKKVSYFDVMVKPGEKQVFNINIRNVVDHAIKVKVVPNTARSTSTGVVDYSDNKLALSDKIPASFEDITTKEQVVELKAKENKDIEFVTTVPEKEFDGVLLGGFYFQEVKDEKEEPKDKKENGVMIKNVFSSVLGVIIRESKKEPEEKFSLKKVELDNYGGYFSLMTHLQNDAAKILKGYSMEGNVQNKKGEKVFEFSKDSFDMAPSSVMPYPEKVNPNDFEKGTYTLKLTVYNSDKSQHWDLSKEFEITRKERNELIEETVDQVNNDWNMWIVIGAAVVIMLLIIVIIVLAKKKKA